MQLIPTRRPATSLYLVVGLLGLMSAVVFFVMQPAELFSSTTPSGGEIWLMRMGSRRFQLPSRAR